MAKKANRPSAPVDVTPGANPHADNSLLSRKLGNVMGAACLLVFILFKELWLGMLAFGIGFAVIFVLEVMVEKTKQWYASWNLYLSVGSLALAYAEYSYGFISGLMKM